MMNHQIPPETLMTKRLILRPFRADDAASMYHNWCKDNRVTETLSFDTHQSIDVTKEVLFRWVDQYLKGPYYHYAMVLRQTNEVIGSIGQVDYEPVHERVEIGYCMGYDYWHQGLTTEAMVALRDYLFNIIGFNKIVMTHASDNMASGRVMQKAGFILEGILKENRKNKKDQFIDMYTYGLTQKDYQQLT